MPYEAIENHGIIGDMHTVALISVNGCIDWLCFPHFDSPSVFAAILDDQKGGHFSIAPAQKANTIKQVYWPDTNVLVTRFLSPDGVAELTDFMPIGAPEDRTGRHDLMRQVRVVRGSMSFRMQCKPAFNYARDSHTTTINKNGAIFDSPSLSLALLTQIALRKDGNGAVAEFSLDENQTASFYLCEKNQNEEVVCPSEEEIVQLRNHTVQYWHQWLSKCTYKGRWREIVHRSALVLKLMTFEPTGAIVASPTCSLPEWIGGGRNWDYRYTWIRDAAFTLYGLLRIGFTEEAASFMDWIEARCKELEPDGSLQTIYGIDGRHDLQEETLTHLDGYKGSRPVRIGNGAYRQLQLDIYGELMDAVYLYNKYGVPISYELWTSLRKLLNWVCDNWQQKDEGIWEVRSGREDFVYSRLMCWVALDRGLRLAEKRSFPADNEKWLKNRDQVYEEIMNRGWSKKRNAFIQAYQSESLGAANLIMPLVLFVSPKDPRMIQTLNAIRQPQTEGGLSSANLVYRYNASESPDGLGDREGTFNMCTFWLVEALTRARELVDARILFEKMLGYANHLGLYSEQTGQSGEALGNFPQAFTHLSLISAAYNLDMRLDQRP
ncbi:MAG: glucoamylase [Acidobacteria bacterium]|nr:MAG: glucoamylase [Acidobacteriota bacterium]